MTTTTPTRKQQLAALLDGYDYGDGKIRVGKSWTYADLLHAAAEHGISVDEDEYEDADADGNVLFGTIIRDGCYAYALVSGVPTIVGG